MLSSKIIEYNNLQNKDNKEICELLSTIIDSNLPNSTNKVWHAHPVWFLDDNPIVGYSKLKDCVRLLFWSGQSFEEEVLENTGSFKAAQINYTKLEQIDSKILIKLLKKSQSIQWDYKNIVKRKGQLLRLK